MTITNISDVERELRAEIARLKEWSKLGLAALEYASTGNRRAELIAPAIAAFKQALAEQPAQQTCNCRWEGEVQVQQCTLHEAHVDAIHEWAERAKSAEHQFKNFHRLLCERFGYTHDERDWRRDQLSLIEWIAKRAEQPAQQEPVECQYGKGGYACCEGGPCKADEQNNAPQPAQQEFVTVPQGCVVVARSVLKKLGIDDDVIDTIARPPAQQEPLTDEQFAAEWRRRVDEVAHGIKENT